MGIYYADSIGRQFRRPGIKGDITMAAARSTKQSVIKLARRLGKIWERVDRLEEIQADASERGNKRRAKHVKAAVTKSFHAALAMENRILNLPARTLADVTVHLMIASSLASGIGGDPAVDKEWVGNIKGVVPGGAMVVAKPAPGELEGVGYRGEWGGWRDPRRHTPRL